MAIPIKKSRKKAEVKNDFEFDEEEDIEICDFSEGEPILEGTLLRSFVFDDSNSEPVEVPLISDNSNNNSNNNTTPISTINSNIEANKNSNNKAASNLINKKISS